MCNIKKIKDKINKTKSNLSKIAQDENKFSSKQIVNVSKKLDKLIIHFYKKKNEVNYS